MMNARELLVASLILAMPTAANAAPDPCRYEAYTPPALARELALGLPVLDISALATPITLEGVPPHRSLLLRDGLIVGQLEKVNDSRRGQFSLRVFDSRQALLFEVAERQGLCAKLGTTGLCKTIEIVTEQQPRLGDMAPFVVEIGPSEYWPSYYRYGERMGHFDWRLALDEAVQWLVHVLAGELDGFRPVMETRVETLFWALASEPGLVPYLPRLAISDYRGRLVVRGVVPSNYVYGLVTQSAIKAGLFGVDPDLVIDTGTALALEPGPTLSTCR